MSSEKSEKHPSDAKNPLAAAPNAGSSYAYPGTAPVPQPNGGVGAPYPPQDQPPPMYSPPNGYAAPPGPPPQGGYVPPPVPPSPGGYVPPPGPPQPGGYVPPPGPPPPGGYVAAPGQPMPQGQPMMQVYGKVGYGPVQSRFSAFFNRNAPPMMPPPQGMPMQPGMYVVPPAPHPQMHTVPPGGVVVYTAPNGSPQMVTTTQMVPMMPPPAPVMAVPANVPSNCPPGLEYLLMLDKLMIKQKVEALEVVTNLEMKNKYKIYNAQGQEMFVAKEDGMRREVLTLSRPFSCTSPWVPFCCLPINTCWLQSMEVRSPLNGTVCGSIEQLYSLFTPLFAINDEVGTRQLVIEGPSGYICCPCECCTSVDFVIRANNGDQIGIISKKWSGVQELFTDADNFGVSFPVDLAVNLKAVLLAAVL
ncbi:Phospholipid scramblase 3 [Quaeritorhiza haematococci]|nr:Phospholipid scramblase 3 [Quaeritorhiza haematococci]